MADPCTPLDAGSTAHIAHLPARTSRILALVLILALLGTIALVASLGTRPLDIAPATFLPSFAAGLLAQLVDGALGMGYGVTSNTLLLAAGVPPASATATVHVAKTFTGAASGLAHWRLGNIDKRIFGRLLVPGVLGALAGASLVTSIDGDVIRPWIALYLLGMGGLILVRAFRARHPARVGQKRLFPVGLIGGFADSVGGGGWGPVVTTTLIGSGHEPRTTIGSVNAAEFVVSLASGLSFAVLIGIQHWESVAGLVLGGMVVAPLAARLTRHVPRRAMMAAVGLLISGLSIFTLVRAFA